jgi:hypothetical protein
MPILLKNKLQANNNLPGTAFSKQYETGKKLNITDLGEVPAT